MPKDDQARVIRAELNNLVRACHAVAVTSGPAAILTLLVEESSELPPKPPLRISEGYAAHLVAVEKARHCDCEATA